MRGRWNLHFGMFRASVPRTCHLFGVVRIANWEDPHPIVCKEKDNSPKGRRVYNFALDSYHNDIWELAQYIRDNICLNLFSGHVEFVTSSEIVLANVKGVQSFREIILLGQQFLKDFSCARFWNTPTSTPI